MNDYLGKLFGSPARVKIMRLFLTNVNQGFESSEISRKTKVNKGLTKRETNILDSAGFIKRKTFIKPARTEGASAHSGGDIIKDKRIKRTKVKGWLLNPEFPQLELFKVLLAGSKLMEHEEIGRRFRKAGKIKLLVVSGIFTQDKDSRLDLMVVGDRLRRAMLESIIKDIEAEVGRELNYAIFDTKEFIYRLNMYDKLIYDVLSYPHERIIESREFSTLPLNKS